MAPKPQSVNFQGGGQAKHHRRRKNQWYLGAGHDGCADGADPETGPQNESDFGGNSQVVQAQRPNGVVDFVNHLQHPLHVRPILGVRPRCRREWGHTLAMVLGAA